MARKLDKMKGDGAPATVATESHSQPHTEVRAQFHTFPCCVSDTGPRSPAPGPHSPRRTHSHTWGSPHSQGQGHRLKTTPHIHTPSPKGLVQAGMIGARRQGHLGGSSPSSWGPPLTICDLLWTKQVASPAHSNVPGQKMPLCCWLVRGSLRHHASPHEQLFTERPAPLTHPPCVTMDIPSHK